MADIISFIFTFYKTKIFSISNAATDRIEFIWDHRFRDAKNNKHPNPTCMLIFLDWQQYCFDGPLDRHLIRPSEHFTKISAIWAFQAILIIFVRLMVRDTDIFLSSHVLFFRFIGLMGCCWSRALVVSGVVGIVKHFVTCSIFSYLSL